MKICIIFESAIFELPESTNLKREMRIYTLKLVTTDLPCVVDYMNYNIKFSYANHSDEMAVLTSAQQSSKHNDEELNMVILRKNQGYIDIDIIESDATTGRLNLNYVFKRNFINEVSKVFDKFCDEFIVLQKKPASLKYNAIGA